MFRGKTINNVQQNSFNGDRLVAAACVFLGMYFDIAVNDEMGGMQDLLCPSLNRQLLIMVRDRHDACGQPTQSMTNQNIGEY